MSTPEVMNACVDVCEIKRRFTPRSRKAEFLSFLCMSGQVRGLGPQ